MTDEKQIHLDEFLIKWQEMKTLPEEHIAAIGLLSFAVSEANALARIYLSQAHEYLGNNVIDGASNVQRFLVIRSWSARLFEAKKSISLGGQKPKTKDKKLLRLSSKAIGAFEEFSQRESFNVVTQIRHQATNHYSFSTAKSNLKHVSRNANCNMYLHEMSGNCFYPFGEELMFHAGLNRIWADVPTKQERDELFKKWLDWNLSANRWLEATHANFTKELIFDALGRNEFQKNLYSVPYEFAGNCNENRTPVFHEGGHHAPTD